MDVASFERVYEAFQDFHAYFSPLFGRRESRERSGDYLQAVLVQSQDRRNAENLSESVGVSARGMQRFLTDAPWDDDVVLGRLQEYLASRLGHPEAVWVLDGSDFPKQGVKSVGVARQYCGRLGKVANCQAGMFLAYVSPRGRALVDKRLYLPMGWTSDDARCQGAGVPEERRAYRSKTELALEMVEQALARGHLRAGWVAGDDAFGMSPPFREGLPALGMRYVLDVPAGFTVWPEAPEWTRPAYPGKGRPRKPRLRSGQRRTMAERAAAIPEEDWQRITVAPGSQGPRVYQFSPSGCGPPQGAGPARSIGQQSFAGTGTAASPATTCPTPLRTPPWKPWPTWAAPDGASKRNSRPRRATWGWTSTRPAPRIKYGAGSGPDGIITSPCVCWRGHFC